MRAWLIFGILIMGGYSVGAQADSTQFRPSLAIGGLFGLSWNEVNFSPPIDQDQLMGSRGAFVFRYISDPHLGIQLELGYDERGWSEADTLLGNYERRIQYVEFGTYSNITIGRRSLKPLILLGTFVGFPLSDQEQIPDGWDTSRRSYYSEDLPNRLQYGLAGGLGFELALGRLSFQLEGRYRSALGNIFPSGTDGFTFSQSRGFTAQGTLLVLLKK